MKILGKPQSGKRGLYVSQGGRYGQISRAYIVPRDPRTKAQMGVRRSFGSITARWRSLTEKQQRAARTVHHQERRGNRRPALQFHRQGRTRGFVAAGND